jgi:hypothetical protein
MILLHKKDIKQPPFVARHLFTVKQEPAFQRVAADDACVQRKHMRVGPRQPVSRSVGFVRNVVVAMQISKRLS